MKFENYSKEALESEKINCLNQMAIAKTQFEKAERELAEILKEIEKRS